MATENRAIKVRLYPNKEQTNYFDNAFEPILVTGDDGKEYNVIPSDQFK